jgi:hypothetical protein
MDTTEMAMSYAEALTAEDIEFGRKLWHSLRGNKKFPAQGVLWLREPEAGEWHLLVASPKVDSLGPRDAYRALADVTRKVPADSAQLLKIELISPKYPVYRALRSVFAKTKSVEGARLGNTQVAGMYINDAYLYEVR